MKVTGDWRFLIPMIVLALVGAFMCWLVYNSI
jgi:hypothetical protein